VPKTWPVILRGVYGLTFPENRVLRNVFGPQREETTGDWRKLHSEKMILYPSINVIWMNKLRNKKCTGHVERLGQRTLHTGFLWGSLKATEHLDGLDVDGRIILNIYLKRERI